ncbi:hypothetical protein M413DRAFT_200222 [Hebeloma cylindrosporum]|uniref:Uncharacterized protein n=1 Tax=Hebeloma cylindrosporum TaxID=76867 RepID=A0A0C2Z2H0_HEBCY|nr:hypothetical protein M413DRAFT_200222 [Hebeloma cylindrosporum h7]
MAVRGGLASKNGARGLTYGLGSLNASISGALIPAGSATPDKITYACLCGQNFFCDHSRNLQECARLPGVVGNSIVFFCAKFHSLLIFVILQVSRGIFVAVYIPILSDLRPIPSSSCSTRKPAVIFTVLPDILLLRVIHNKTSFLHICKRTQHEPHRTYVSTRFDFGVSLLVSRTPLS